jgi:hypothetical protein
MHVHYSPQKVQKERRMWKWIEQRKEQRKGQRKGQRKRRKKKGRKGRLHMCHR